MTRVVSVSLNFLKSAFSCSILFIAITACFNAKGATITVPAGGDLQGAINAAQPGDVIILQAGIAYVGPIVLPVKPGSDFITIQSSRIADLPAGVRVTPAQRSLMASVTSAVPAEPIVKTQPGAHHFKFIGIEFSTADSSVFVYTLMEFGTSAQTTLEAVPHHLVIDRSYIHGFPTQEVQRGIGANSAYTDVLNSHISDVHGRGYDTQAICGWNGPGPFKIINNYLEAAGENVMFGGAPAAIPNLVPTDITVRNNYFFKPLSWYVNDPSYAGIHWTVKNLFELKNARQVVVEGNIFENNWTDAQAGRSIVFTPRTSDSGAAAVVEDVAFQNNIVRNVGSGLSFLGIDDPPQPQEVRLRRVRVTNNLFQNIDGPRFGSNGVFATVINGTDGVVIEHNTVIGSTGSIIVADYIPNTGFVFRNNIVRHNEYGIFGSGYGIGNPGIAYYFPGSIIKGNLIAKEVNAPWNIETIYPSGNYYPATLNDVGFVDIAAGNYRLASSSLYKLLGTDGADIGCDIDVLAAALNGASTPVPTPTATPTPTPTPAPTTAASVSFVRLDTTTEGNWKNVYGSEGYNTVNDSVNYPSYAQVSVTGYSSPTWMASTTDVRALQKASASDRVAARWDSTSFLTIDLNLTDGASHQIAIYGLDWDGNNRIQRIDVLDWASNVLLDSRTISSFNGGQYLVWNIKGRVKIIVNKLGGRSAVVSGLYFSSAVVTPTATPTPTPTPSPSGTPNTGKQLGKTKRQGQDLSNHLVSSSSSTDFASTTWVMDSSAQTALAEFVLEINNTYDIFKTERNLYPAAARLDVALNKAIAAGGLATQAANQGDLSGVRLRLRQAIDNLELSDVLIRYGDVANPIDVPSYMVRQQYVDFLDREPDESGSVFWVNQIVSCGTDAHCVEIKRINVSAAFYRSIEFQETGYYVYRLYRSSYGRVPLLREFLPDNVSIARGLIVGNDGWQTRLGENKTAFVRNWVQRADFRARYDQLTNDQYVDTLILNLGGTITGAERDALVQDLIIGAVSRSDVLARLVENPAFSRAEYNSAFVLMQYFGYLRRDPDSIGFNFWSSKLNEFDGNFVNAEMVKAFLISSEYRRRFGQ